MGEGPRDVEKEGDGKQKKTCGYLRQEWKRDKGMERREGAEAIKIVGTYAREKEGEGDRKRKKRVVLTKALMSGCKLLLHVPRLSFFFWLPVSG